MSVIKNVADITSIICNKKQSCQAVQKQLIFIADTDHDYIIDKIEHYDHIDYEIQIHNDDK